MLQYLTFIKVKLKNLTKVHNLISWADLKKIFKYKHFFFKDQMAKYHLQSVIFLSYRQNIFKVMSVTVYLLKYVKYAFCFRMLFRCKYSHNLSD